MKNFRGARDLFCRRRIISFTHRSDCLGWRQQPGGLWDFGIFIENGRIGDGALRDALREMAALGDGDFLMTPNQNIMLVNIAERGRVQQLFARRGLDFAMPSGIRQNAMACVAFPTCPLAMAESERYLPSLLTQLESLLARHDLLKDEISIRMTGCPNGCARPYLGEIGLVGKSPGRYNLYLGHRHGANDCRLWRDRICRKRRLLQHYRRCLPIMPPGVWTVKDLEIF